MKFPLAALAVVFGILGSCSAALSDISSPEDIAALQAVRKLKDAGHYPEAEKQLHQLILRTEGKPASEEAYVTALHELAGCNMKMEQYGAALKIYEKLDPLIAKLIGKENRGYATMLDNWAQACVGDHQYGKAEELQKRSIETYEKCKPVPEADLGEDYSNLAQTYLREGKLDKAFETDELALKMLGKVLPGNSPGLGILLDNMGVVLRLQGKVAEGESYNRKAIAILTPLGVHPDVASALDNLACCLASQGKYPEAFSLFDRELVMWKQLYGPDCRQARECTHRRAAIAGQSKAQAPATK